jgi:biopolymer transport protein ExbB
MITRKEIAMHSMIQGLAKQFQAGGPFMWVILVVFAVAVAVVLERVFFYFVICRGNGVKLVADVAKALNADDVDQAKKIVCCKRAPMNVLLETAVDRYGAGMGFNDIQEGVEEAAIKEMPRMTQRLNYLSLFANIGTLLGLLGTIAGLQLLFGSLASAKAEEKAAMLAAGIAQAMNATAFGLLTAIPCMILYTMLYNKQSQITKDLDESVTRLLNYLRKKKVADGGERKK